jgi:hypothetical protein
MNSYEIMTAVIPEQVPVLKLRLQDDLGGVVWYEDGNLYHQPISGEELWRDAGYNVMFKKSSITVLIHGREHIICSKNKLWEAPEYDSYNKEITQSYVNHFRVGKEN